MTFIVHSSSRITDSIFVFRIYSKDINALSALIEDARQLYLKVSEPNVIIRSADKVWPACSSCAISFRSTIAQFSGGLR